MKKVLIGIAAVLVVAGAGIYRFARRSWKQRWTG